MQGDGTDRPEVSDRTCSVWLIIFSVFCLSFFFLCFSVWSLGCVIIEMASAKPPWSEQNFENPFRALYHIGNSDAIPKIPDTLSEVGLNFVRQCLRRNPDERPDAATLLRQEWLSGIESLPNTSDDSGSDGEEEGELKSGSDSD